MDLSTTYMGFELPHPLIPGASPLADDLDTVRLLEDAGAGAIVLRSLFEEQIRGEQLATHHHIETPAESFAEALSFFPAPTEFALGPEEYLEHIRRIKDAVDVPVMASLNGSSPGGWLTYARLIADAGADALELNVYEVPTNAEESGAEREHRTLEVVRAVTTAVSIPVAVKLSPFYSSLPHFASQLDGAGIRGLILFNRFYQPDIDPEELEAAPTLRLSTSDELPLRLTWLAILSPRIRASMAVSGGVHTGRDVVKAVMAGCAATQLVSALLTHGPEHLKVVRAELIRWMEENEHDSLSAMRGAMDLNRCPDPGAYERGNYMRVLHSWRAFT